MAAEKPAMSAHRETYVDLLWKRYSSLLRLTAEDLAAEIVLRMPPIRSEQPREYTLQAPVLTKGRIYFYAWSVELTAGPTIGVAELFAGVRGFGILDQARFELIGDTFEMPPVTTTSEVFSAPFRPDKDRSQRAWNDFIQDTAKRESFLEGFIKQLRDVLGPKEWRPKP